MFEIEILVMVFYAQKLYYKKKACLFPYPVDMKTNCNFVEKYWNSLKKYWAFVKTNPSFVEKYWVSFSLKSIIVLTSRSFVEIFVSKFSQDSDFSHR